MKTSVKTLLIVSLCLIGASAHADLGVRLDLEHTTLHRLETAAVFVIVTNRGSSTVVLDGRREPGHGRLDFDVRRVNEGAVKRLRPAPLDRPLDLLPGEGRRLLVELDRAFDLSALGAYIIEAYVELDELRYGTQPLSLDIVTGLPIATVNQTVPGKPGVIRTVNLTYLTREQRETLFLSVDEPRSGLNYGVFALGPLVRVFRPVLETQGAGRITVVHQSGPRQYMRSILESTPGGVRLVDQSYESVKGHVDKSGEWIEPAVQPTPTPVQKSKPAANR